VEALDKDALLLLGLCFDGIVCVPVLIVEVGNERED
jgi:hypothetical protein